MNTLGASSQAKLLGVDVRLVDICELAIGLSSIPFRITEGVRSPDRQRFLFRTGKSKTMASLHLLGRAVDVVAIVGGRVSWDWVHYEAISVAMKSAALSLDLEIEWGGDWGSFKDGVHFQLRE